MTDLVEKWNQEYFEGRLSTDVLYLLKDLPGQSAEVHAFVTRVFRFMKQAKFRPEDFSLLLGWAVGFLPSRILPGAWGGLIPPITIEGRHSKIDTYLELNNWHPLGESSSLLDLGCGFPPQTTVDTAKSYPGWQIIGADPSFGRYILHDEFGDYACFKEDGTLRYFQPSSMDLPRWDDLYKDPDATRSRFVALYKRLRQLPANEISEDLKITEEDSAKLIENPLRMYERSNLTFREGGIGAVDVRNLDAVRCMNVLMYFDAAFREKARRWVAEILKVGGIFICGVDWVRTTSARYTVYQKESNRLVAKEFAFSIENIRAVQFVSWFALHDDDPETCLLAEAVGVLRSDHEFCRDFDHGLDRLLSEIGICPRRSDGYLGGVEEGITPQELERRLATIGELDSRGFVERGVEVLTRAGYNAWRNCVGHISFTPRGA